MWPLKHLVEADGKCWLLRSCDLWEQEEEGKPSLKVPKRGQDTGLDITWTVLEELLTIGSEDNGLDDSRAPSRPRDR